MVGAKKFWGVSIAFFETNTIVCETRLENVCPFLTNDKKISVEANSFPTRHQCHDSEEVWRFPPAAIFQPGFHEYLVLRTSVVGVELEAYARRVTVLFTVGV